MPLLKNKTRQPLVFNLDTTFHVGNRNETPVGKPCTLSFLALEKKEVDDAVLSCGVVKAALQNGTLRDVTPPKKREKALSATATGVAQTKPGKGGKRKS